MVNAVNARPTPNAQSAPRSAVLGNAVSARPTQIAQKALPCAKPGNAAGARTTPIALETHRSAVRVNVSRAQLTHNAPLRAHFATRALAVRHVRWTRIVSQGTNAKTDNASPSHAMRTRTAMTRRSVKTASALFSAPKIRNAKKLKNAKAIVAFPCRAAKPRNAPHRWFAPTEYANASAP
jgi:hypothetical protein